MLAAENGTDKAECIEVTLTHNISLHGLWVEKASSILQAIVCNNALLSCCLLAVNEKFTHDPTEANGKWKGLLIYSLKTPREEPHCNERRNFQGYNAKRVCVRKCKQLTYSNNMRHPVRVVNPKETCNQRCPVFPNRTPGRQPSVSHGCKVAGSTF